MVFAERRECARRHTGRRLHARSHEAHLCNVLVHVVIASADVGQNALDRLFRARQIGGDLTVEGDPDHEAEDAIWVDFDDLDDVLSYPNERKIAWLYARKMKQG